MRSMRTSSVIMYMYLKKRAWRGSNSITASGERLEAPGSLGRGAPGAGWSPEQGLQEGDLLGEPRGDRAGNRGGNQEKI